MTFKIALPFYEFQEHFHSGYYVKDFYAEFGELAYGKPKLIDIEYKYGDYESGQTVIHWRCCYNSEPKTDWHTTTYGNSTDFATWWCANTDDNEEDDSEEDDSEEEEYHEAKCYWCNARGCDVKNEAGFWIHSDCA